METSQDKNQKPLESKISQTNQYCIIHKSILERSGSGKSIVMLNLLLEQNQNNLRYKSNDD